MNDKVKLIVPATKPGKPATEEWYSKEEWAKFKAYGLVNKQGVLNGTPEQWANYKELTNKVSK